MSRSTSKHHTSPQKKAARGLPKPALLALLAAIGAVILGAFFLMFRGGSAEPYTPEVTGAPSLRVEQDLIDYGDVKFEQPVEAVFKLKNVGDQTLNITQIPQVQILQGC